LPSRTDVERHTGPSGLRAAPGRCGWLERCSLVRCQPELFAGAPGGGGLGGPLLILPQPGHRIGQRRELGEQRQQLRVLVTPDEAGG